VTAMHTSTDGAGSALGPAVEADADGWLRALAEFDHATRSGESFVAPAVDGPGGLGPMPVELRAHAEQLLVACMARVEAVQAEMDQVRDELGGLHRRTSVRSGWTDDAQGAAPGAGHLV